MCQIWCFYHKMHDSLIFGDLAAGLHGDIIGKKHLATNHLTSKKCITKCFLMDFGSIYHVN